MELTTLIVAIVALAVSVAVLGVCACLLRRVKASNEGDVSAQVRDAMREQTDAVNANTALLLKGYSDTVDSRMQQYGSRQERVGEQTFKQLADMAETMRTALREQRLEMEQKLDAIRVGLDAKQRENIETTAKSLEALRAEVAGQLTTLRTENNAQLDRMRAVVDKELQENLQNKLTQSFQLISDNLNKIYTSMGEMQAISTDMNDLKRVLSGVKTRGVWGEASLATLLTDLLSNEQYEVNFHPSPRSTAVVEFAVRLPGKNDGESVYLPIDSKFPREDYERLVSCADQGDKAGLEEAGKALETCIKKEARDIHDKYIKPPRTTEFAILYVPIEGLFAELMRRDGLAETLRNDYRVLVAGPTTLAALLNSLQMGFKTLAVEKRSKEIWDLLAVVHRQFKQFAKSIEQAERQLATASNTLRVTGERTRSLSNKLDAVQKLDAYAAADTTDDIDDTEE